MEENVRLTFNESPAWLTSRGITTESDVRFQVGYYASRAIYSLLCDTLEEEIKGFDEPLLGSRRRSRNEAPIVTLKGGYIS
jgi:hypothetical protein